MRDYYFEEIFGLIRNVKEGIKKYQNKFEDCSENNKEVKEILIYLDGVLYDLSILEDFIREIERRR